MTVGRFAYSGQEGREAAPAGFVSVAEKVDRMRRAHVAVLPSLKEGWGLTVVEAGATVERSVVADGVVIRAGGRVRQSILLGAVTLAPGEAVDGVVLACR